MITKREFSLAFVLVFAVSCEASLGADPPAAEYLSETLAERMVSLTQGWGELGINTSVNPVHKPAMKLRIKDKDYERGLGHHAPGEITIELGGQFKTFLTDVGIQWQGGSNQASVVFQVFVDDKKVFDSGVMRENDPSRQVSVSVEGAEELRLVADDAGDGITCDCANWADARLVRNPAATKRPLATGVDIVPFGKVCTWDPKQVTGTKAGRVDEIPADDLFPAKDLLPAADGSYKVPDWSGTGCIGVRWDENRLVRQLVLRFPDAASVPAPGSIQLQYWTGESAWQGAWQPVNVAPEKIENALVWSLGFQGFARGTQKVRFLVPTLRVGTGASAAPRPESDAPRSGGAGVPTQSVGTRIAKIEAYTRSAWTTVDVRIESTRPASAPKAEIEVYNGVVLGAGGETASGGGTGGPHLTFDPAKPLELKLRSAISKRYKADRTVLRFRFPDTAFAVAIEDLLANDCVYVPHAGLFVTRLPVPITLDAYLKKIAAKSSVLAEVRKKPDQDFARAMAVVHNPIQDLGPTMLSLACDNRKFVVHRDGTVVFDEYNGPDDKPHDIPDQWQLVPKFGSGKNLTVTRDLNDDWFPSPIIRAKERDVSYFQLMQVAPVGDRLLSAPAWLRERALGVAHHGIENRGAKAAEVSLSLTFVGAKKQPIELKEFKGGVAAISGNRLLAVINTADVAPLTVKVQSAGIVFFGTLPGATPSQRVMSIPVYFPTWKAASTEAADIIATPEKSWFTSTGDYWWLLMAPAVQIELPDRPLTNVIRASQVHCMLAARSEDHGKLVSPWISSDRYGPLESEANSIIRGMDMMGHTEFARRSLEFFIKRYNKQGYLTTGYTMVGTGEHLWTLAEHYQRTRDRAWMQKIAPEVARVCQWIVGERAKTKRLDMHGHKVPEYGLMPPGVTADWNRYAYRFFNDAQYCAGLEAAARVLAEVGHPAAPALLEDARQYREDLLRAYRWTQGRSPVMPLDSGAWVPDGSALLDCFGRTDDFLPGEDGNRSWAYCVEIGAHHLAATKILDPRAEEVAWIADYLEDVQFLRSGMGDYPEEKNRKDVFCFGGFPKVQPYYGRIAEVYALRDDVKPFVRSYFNTIPTLLSRENLSFWEHFHNIGGWNKTHETGWFLCQTRIMLVMERGEELWLAPMATNHWFKDGMKISVRNAPTNFGKVSYTIRSAVSSGHIEAEIQPPKERPPQKIVIRLRHPDGKPMRSVTVQGKPHKDFDPVKETVTLAPTAEPITVHAQY